jgi:hypothetical protein
VEREEDRRAGPEADQGAVGRRGTSDAAAWAEAGRQTAAVQATRRPRREAGRGAAAAAAAAAADRTEGEEEIAGEEAEEAAAKMGQPVAAAAAGALDAAAGTAESEAESEAATALEAAVPGVEALTAVVAEKGQTQADGRRREEDRAPDLEAPRHH